jgi:hypothetical protein
MCQDALENEWMKEHFHANALNVEIELNKKHKGILSHGIWHDKC